MNYSRRSILPGEKVIYTLLQPEIQVILFRFLSETLAKTIIPAHITILTDRELITIREESRGWFNQVRYGGIWNYIPLPKITSTSLKPKTEHTITLSIDLPQNDTLQTLFADSNKDEVDLLVNRLNDLRPGYAQAV